MPMPVEHFKSNKAYRDWNAYRHIHGIPAPHLQEVVVAGKRHKVKHSALSKGKSRKSVIADKAFGG
jgi:hypothetical protein